jgi:hypothetical protein
MALPEEQTTTETTTTPAVAPKTTSAPTTTVQPAPAQTKPAAVAQTKPVDTNQPAPIAVPPAVAPAAVPTAPATSTDATATSGKLYNFLAPSRRVLDRSKYSTEQLAEIDRKMNEEGVILSDAEAGVDTTKALHRILTGDTGGSKEVPGARYAVNVDVDSMSQNVMASTDLSVDDKDRLGRALNVFRKMKENNFQVMRGTGGTYWLESTEGDGKRVYAANNIREVADLLNKYSAPPVKGEEPPATPKTVITQPKKLKSIMKANPDKDMFTTSEKWYLASLATDLGTSLAGVVGKLAAVPTGGTSGAIGTGVAIGGGIAALGMQMMGDYYNDDVSAWEMAKNAGTRVGLEALETVSILPVSVIHDLKMTSTAGKVLRKGIQVYMLSGVLSTAVGTDWLKIINKEGNWDMEDYRKMATMAQFMVGTVGGAAANRYSTKKGIANKSTQALIPDEAVGAAKTQELAGKQAANIAWDKTRAGSIADKARTKAAAIHDDAVGTVATRNKDSRAALNVETKAKVQAAKAELSHQQIGQQKAPEGQQVLDFEAPALPPPVDAKTKLRSIGAEAREKAKAIKAETTTKMAELDAKLKTRNERVDKMVSTSDKLSLEKNTARTQKEAKAAMDEHQARGQVDRDKIIARSKEENGSVLTNRLISKAEKKAGISEADMTSNKPQAPKPASSAPKLEILKKQKAEFEDKHKDIKPEDRPADYADKTKEFDDAIAAEQKATTGIRGAKNRLIENTKSKANSLKEKGKGLVRKGNALQSYIVSSDGVSGRALAAGYLTADGAPGVDKYYQYDRTQAISRLKQEGFDVSDAHKYDLYQLRRAIHKVEQEKQDKADKYTPDKKEDIDTTKRPKLRKHGWGGVIGKFQNGATIPKTDTVAVLGPVKNVDANNLTTTSVFDNIDPLVAQVAEAAKNTTDPKDKKALEDAYDKIITGAKALKTNPNQNNYSEWMHLIQDLRVSDLFIKNKIFVEHPVQKDVIAPVLYSRGVSNMPGYMEAMSRTTLIPRADTADSFASAQMAKEYFNEGEKRRNDIIGKNASFVENGRDNEMAIRNRNVEAAANAENINTQRQNENERNYSAQMAQARAQKDTLDMQRNGRIANAITTGLTRIFVSRKTDALTQDFNKLAGIKSVWNNEYKPRFDNAVATGDTLAVKKIKSEFITDQGYNPDDLDKSLMDLKAQYRLLGVK